MTIRYYDNVLDDYAKVCLSNFNLKWIIWNDRYSCDIAC